METRLQALQQTQFHLSDAGRVLLHDIENVGYDLASASQQHRGKLVAHMQGDCILSLLYCHSKHRGDEGLTRFKAIILRAEHLQVQERVVQLELQKLMAYSLKVDIVDEREYDLNEPTWKVPVCIVNAYLLLDKIRRLKILCEHFFFREHSSTFFSNSEIFLRDLKWIETFD